MSAEEEIASDGYPSSDAESVVVEEEEGDGLFNNLVQPYQDEPIVAIAEDDTADGNDEDDEDGILFDTLASRFEAKDDKESARNWCLCGGKCKVENLTTAREFRCCREIAQASRILTFDGSIERISCVTQHTDYAAMTNREVLKLVAPLLRDKDGKTYRRRGNQTENELLRAVGYRWLVRWMCGYLGWGKSRPLSACIYEDIRTRYLSSRVQGYSSSEARS